MWLRELSSTVAPLLGALLLSASTSPVPSLDDFALRPLFPFTTRACGDGLKDCDGYCIPSNGTCCARGWYCPTDKVCSADAWTNNYNCLSKCSSSNLTCPSGYLCDKSTYICYPSCSDNVNFCRSGRCAADIRCLAPCSANGSCAGLSGYICGQDYLCHEFCPTKPDIYCTQGICGTGDKCYKACPDGKSYCTSGICAANSTGGMTCYPACPDGVSYCTNGVCGTDNLCTSATATVTATPTATATRVGFAPTPTALSVPAGSSVVRVRSGGKTVIASTSLGGLVCSGVGCTMSWNSTGTYTAYCMDGSVNCNTMTLQLFGSCVSVVPGNIVAMTDCPKKVRRDVLDSRQSADQTTRPLWTFVRSSDGKYSLMNANMDGNTGCLLVPETQRTVVVGSCANAQATAFNFVVPTYVAPPPSGPPIAAIVGGVVGGVALIAVVSGLTYYFVKRNAKNKQAHEKVKDAPETVNKLSASTRVAMPEVEIPMNPIRIPAEVAPQPTIVAVAPNWCGTLTPDGRGGFVASNQIAPNVAQPVVRPTSIDTLVSSGSPILNNQTTLSRAASGSAAAAQDYLEPTNEVLEPAKQSSQPELLAMVNRRFYVDRDFAGREEDELNVERGDLVLVLETCDDQWGLVRRVTPGRSEVKGMVPLMVLKEI